MSEAAGRPEAPAVGVVIPARNAAAYLRDAIDSVLAQRPQPADVVIVDDGSTDDTVEITRAYGAPVRSIEQPASGPAVARNRGIAALSTEFVAFLDADDMWADGSLALRQDALAGDQSLDAVFGAMERFTSEDQERQEGSSPRVSALEPGLVLGTMLCRRAVFERFGMLAEQRRGGEFIEWLLLARRGGLRITMLPQVVLRRRIHSSNLTRLETDRINADYLSIARAAVARSRSSPDE